MHSLTQPYMLLHSQLYTLAAFILKEKAWNCYGIGEEKILSALSVTESRSSGCSR